MLAQNSAEVHVDDVSTLPPPAASPQQQDITLDETPPKQVKSSSPREKEEERLGSAVKQQHAEWTPNTVATQPQWNTANAETAVNRGRRGEANTNNSNGAEDTALVGSPNGVNGQQVVAISFSRAEERRMHELEGKIAEALMDAKMKKQQEAKRLNAALDSPARDDDEQYEAHNDACDAALESNDGDSITTEKEKEAIKLAALSPAEQEELNTLHITYKDFCDEGERRLKQGAMDRQRQLDYEANGGAIGSFFSGMSSTATSMASAVGTGAKKAAGAGFFWGSLVATAAPGYVGRKAGLTTGYRHWNWISDKLILGALPIITQVGSSGNHLQQLQEQLAERSNEHPMNNKNKEGAAPPTSTHQLQLGQVVACLNEEEMNGYGLNLLEFCQEKHWRPIFDSEDHPPLKYTRLPMPDMTADTPVEPVIAAVDEMHKTMSEERRVVYVHCKAGKGRSWMVVICYLTTHGGMSFEDAEALVRMSRHQVSPSAAQTRFAKAFAGEYEAFKQFGGAK